ncbi:MAG TPA: hypothetical protein VI612_05420, partial [Candidatus Nanoarchaeia archaeon]|nr:hypothetical protein [Candidatus Nanoarchaeia archaeon]
FYLVTVCRPLVSEMSTQDMHHQRIAIVKIENRVGDLLHDELKAEHARTVKVQKALLSDLDALTGYKNGKLESGACDTPTNNFAKAGCFDEERARCTRLFEVVRKHGSLRAYLEKLRE